MSVPPSWALHTGDCLKLLPALPPESFDELIADPPYSSGADRAALPSTKYMQHGTLRRFPDFYGDNRDQRSWTRWCSLWLADCHRLLKPGAYALVFTDWRQLACTTDALQAGGFVFRGVIAWNKGPSARAPHKGYARHQCEYIVWGTKGPCPKRADAGPFPGCFDIPVVRTEKRHMTGKPIALMHELVRFAPAAGRILNPFAGSAPDAEAAVKSGRTWLGIELSEEIGSAARLYLEERLGPPAEAA